MPETNTQTDNTDVVQNDKAAKQPKVDFTRKLTRIILTVSLCYFAWYIIGDRITPTTDQARVRSSVIPIVPQVAGKITKIHVGGDKQVKAGDLLFEIDPRDYQIALEQAQANLELAGQDVGANTANVAAAQAKVDKAIADHHAKEVNANRIFAVADKGIVTQADVAEARGIVDVAAQEVLNAKAALEQAKQLMGQAGQENAKIQNALASLSDAQLDLDRTKVKAPSDGVVSYAKANVGYYAGIGNKIMTFISTEYIWVEAYYRENNLGNMKTDDPVDIVLDSAPGEIFKGKVVSIGYGVSFDQSVPGELPTPQKSTGWMREPQRFTVMIRINAVDKINRRLLREGGQADIITYTGDNTLFNGLGKVWIWITSQLSYIY